MGRLTKILGLVSGAALAAIIAFIVFSPGQNADQNPKASVSEGLSGFSLSDLINRRNTFQNINAVPMFMVEAVGFKAVDESGIDWPGSDEVVAIWHASNSVGANTYEYGGVDSGESREILQKQTCIYPINSDRFINGNIIGPDGSYKGWECVRDGGIGPIFFRAHLYEMDGDWTALIPACFDQNVETEISSCEDDHLGGYSVTYTVNELVEMLPTVGATKEITVEMDWCLEALIGNVCSSFWNPPNYDFTYRITRMEDLEIPQKAVDE
jgi:hypothetical protein